HTVDKAVSSSDGEFSQTQPIRSTQPCLYTSLTTENTCLGQEWPIFIYSDLDATCLCVHKFWKKKEIAWKEVTSAGRFRFGADDVIVRFGHQIEDYGNIIVQPADRDEFLAAIHQYAPQAEIDV
ncbi:MAG: hypothetical protein ACLQGT_02335, partial [Terracidiphilus sp.]